VLSFGEVVITSVCSIGLAAAGFGAYSFVLPVPFARAARVLILWRAARACAAGRRQAGWDLSWRRLRRSTRLLPAASAALGTTLLATLVAQGDYIVLGLIIANPAAVGVYFLAFKLAIQPLRMLAGSFSGVLFPTLVQYRNDPLRQRDAALRVSQMLSAVVMPICFLQATLAHPLLEVFFAPRWQGAAPFMQLLSIGLAFDASSWAAGAFLQARGEFKRSFIYSLIAAPLFFAFVSAGALLHEAFGVAVGVALFYILLAPVYCYAVFRPVGATSWRAIALIYVAPALLSAAASSAAYAFAAGLSRAPLFLLGATPIVALAIYVPLLRLVCPELYQRIKEQLLALRRAQAASAT
jgi:PST family polysaccharide transporter